MNLCWRNSPYSLNCHVCAMLVFRMLRRITQSSDAHRTESVSVMDHEQTTGVNSRVLDQKQQNIVGRISLLWSVELQGHPEQLIIIRLRMKVRAYSTLTRNMHTTLSTAF